MSATPAIRPSPGVTLSPSQSQSWLKLVEAQIEGLKFGSVGITVHEGRVVQVETSIKVRLDKAS